MKILVTGGAGYIGGVVAAELADNGYEITVVDDLRDIARAHVLALKKLDKLNSRAYNLGSGSGYSVLQVIEAARRVTGAAIPVKDSPRRAADPAVLVAGAAKAKEELGWTPQFNDIERIIATAWQWTKDHPEGYGDLGARG